MITKNLIKQYQQKYSNNPVNWNFTLLKEWEYKMLLKIGAINEQAIVCDGSSLKIENGNGEASFNNFNGNKQMMNEEFNRLNIMGGNNKVSIIKYPKTYIEYKDFKNKELERSEKQAFAIKVNTPPLFAI